MESNRVEMVPFRVGRKIPGHLWKRLNDFAPTRYLIVHGSRLRLRVVGGYSAPSVSPAREWVFQAGDGKRRGSGFAYRNETEPPTINVARPSGRALHPMKVFLSPL